ncbi:MAG TPA: alpha-ketoacid dehydrogenase subunit beta [candidate division Zixibacteria bacterium]|nr:alpha-ketoacid dehydrogenase subunit beta [candidate division Zixibacteria bacterium]
MKSTYLEAISSGLREEMARDESVFCLGEDIGVYGGAFKVTDGLFDEFGEDRVIDTPLAEAAIIGAAMGSAIMGMRPVAEMQFADFITTGFNQLVNNAAKTYYRWGAKVPMVIRCPSGAIGNAGPFHSQNPEAWFFRVPGLKIVTPSTPYDAKGLLKAAIRDNNPVLYFEHKALYRDKQISQVLPDEDYTVPIGEAALRREGTDITIISYGKMVHKSLEAAEVLSKDGIDVEVLDLRSLLPFDREMILTSVKKTSRLLIVHEDTLTGGIGGEMAAIIADEAFEYLDAPIKRVAAIDTPVPFSPPLENFFLPNTEKIVETLRDLAAF